MFQTLSIKNKIILVILTTSLLTLTLGVSIIVGIYYENSRSSFVADLNSKIEMLGHYSQGPLALDFFSDAENIIRGTTITHPHSIALYDEDTGNMILIDNGGGHIQAAKHQVNDWQGDWYYLVEPVLDVDGEKLGAVHLKVSTRFLITDILRFTSYMLAVTAVLFIFCLFVAIRIQRYISKPILELENASKQVTRTNDLSLRVPVTSDDEVGALSQTFNSMLAAIETHQAQRALAEQALKENKKRLEQAIEDLEYIANYDALTKLPNRALCLDRLRFALLNAKQKQTKLAVAFLDLDNFKDVNDSIGHGVGDELLRLVGSNLAAIIKEGDTLARLGGDEFVIIINDVNGRAMVEPILERILSCFSETFALQENFVTTSVSIGVSLYPDDGDNSDLLLKYSDAAMYKAKSEGGNRYRFFEQEMNAVALYRLNIANELRRAIDHNEFQLVYQPQFDCINEEIIGVESLIRWHHPQRGIISPEDFIPVAESSGLITEISAWLLEEACSQLKAWRDIGFDNIVMSVNLSAVQFNQPNLTEQISQLLNKYSLPTTTLGIELTESMVMRNVEQSIRVLREMKRMGIKISIDDFGTGYSSLAYIQKLPLDTVKIDRSFINEIPSNSDAAAITHAIISMTKSLRLHVIAEGVETEEQKIFLMKHGCDRIQGFLISPGVPADAIKSLLQGMNHHHTPPNSNQSATH